MQEKAHPQTRINTIGKYGCLMFCYMYCCGIDPDNTAEYFKIASDAIDAGVDISGVAEDCTVMNAEKFIKWLTGRDVRVYKKVVANIVYIDKLTPVRFYYINEEAKRIDHFVVVEGGMVVFDPILDSRSVAIGRPDSARCIEYI